MSKGIVDISGWIYLIDDGGFYYKIGYATDPKKRLANLQTSHPEELRLVALIPGTKRQERELHELFSGDRVRGEWFTKSLEIRDYFKKYGKFTRFLATVTTSNGIVWHVFDDGWVVVPVEKQP